ncbi:MAG: IS21 family transposase [Actinomycetota bacterium]|nr:IS21 family transposase [Actinomycetota bacterium]
MVGVEQWAELRRMHRVERLSIREIHRRTGLHRETIRRALGSDKPPSYRRAARASKLDPFKGELERLLREDPRIPNTRLRELIEELGYEGGKTILDEQLRELRPRYQPPRTYQRTVYRPGELCQFDLWEPRGPVPVGHGQLRRGFVVTAELGYSRALSGALVFSKGFDDLAWGMSRCLQRLGALPEKLVWDREGAIHAGGGRPTEAFAAFCGQLSLGWVILDAGDAEAKGALERSHRFMRTNFEPGRRFANELDFQAQLDAWTEKANARTHRTIRAVPAERLTEEAERMRPLPSPLPATERRFVTRVAQQPYLRFDTNDYSLDPTLAGRRVEVRISQREISASALDTSALAASHRRVFAKHLSFTDPAHQAALERLRGERRSGPEVEVRPLSRYDALIPA